MYNRVSFYIQGPALDLINLRTLPAGNQVLMGTCHDKTITLALSQSSKEDLAIDRGVARQTF